MKKDGPMGDRQFTFLFPAIEPESFLFPDDPCQFSVREDLDDLLAFFEE